jgi:hypothetical protein
MCKLKKNRERRKELEKERERLVVMVCVVVHLVNHLNKKPFRPLKLLTSGNPILSNEQNEIISMHVFEYIKRSERFLV